LLSQLFVYALHFVLEIEPTSVQSISDIKKWLENGHDLPYLIAAMEAVPVAKVYAMEDL
jgi:hypothetical protein